MQSAGKCLHVYRRCPSVPGMDRKKLNRHALTALLDAHTAHQRWESRARFCSDAGIHPSSLSLAEKGERGMSLERIEAVADTLGVPVEAITANWDEEDPYTRRIKHNNGTHL